MHDAAESQLQGDVAAKTTGGVIRYRVWPARRHPTRLVLVGAVIVAATIGAATVFSSLYWAVIVFVGLTAAAAPFFGTRNPGTLMEPLTVEDLVAFAAVPVWQLGWESQDLDNAAASAALDAWVAPEGAPEKLSLSPTQMRVAEYLAAGARRSEIAAALEVSAETVRSHVRAVYERLEVATPMELARLLEEHA